MSVILHLLLNRLFYNYSKLLLPITIIWALNFFRVFSVILSCRKTNLMSVFYKWLRGIHLNVGLSLSALSVKTQWVFCCQKSIFPHTFFKVKFNDLLNKVTSAKIGILLLILHIRLKSPSMAKLVKTFQQKRLLMLFSYNTERFNLAYAAFIWIFNKTLNDLPAKLFYVLCWMTCCEI